MPLLAAAICAGLTLVSLATPALAERPARLYVPGPVGTVDTVAGPGFCDGPTVPDPDSYAVGALAVDPAAVSTVWFEAGRVGEGLITKVLNTAGTLIERTGPDMSADAADGGRARFASASRLAADGVDAVLVAKPRAVLRLTHGGLVTLAGSSSTTATEGGVEPAGDGGPLGAARFTHIGAIATDGSGNVYVADVIDPEAGTVTIRFLNRRSQAVTFYRGTKHELTVAPGTIETIAGSGRAGVELPGGPGLVAVAPALAVAGEALYLSASGPDLGPQTTVSVINLGGSNLSAHGKTVGAATMASVITVIAAATDSGPRTPGPARVATVPAIAADGAGNLFLAEAGNHRVRRVDAAGAVSTIAGTGSPGFNGNDRPSTTARLNSPYDVDLAAGGRIYISDAGNSQVRFVDHAGIIHAGLGNGAAARSICTTEPTRGRGTSRSPAPGRPAGLAVDRSGNVYITASAIGALYSLAPSATVSPIKFDGGEGCGDAGECSQVAASVGKQAPLVSPAAVAVRPKGGLYVQDDTGIRFLNLSEREAVVHGVGVPPGALRRVIDRAAPANGNGGSGRATVVGARVGFGALAADSSDNLFLADHDPGGPASAARLRQADARGDISTLFALPDAGLVGGEVDATRCCAFVAGVTLDATGNLYLAASGRVWFLNRGNEFVVVHGVTVAPDALEPVAGSAGDGSPDEGIPALDADLGNPHNLALDPSGNLYVIIAGDHAIRRVDVGGTITTVAGNGQAGFNGDGLKGRLTALNEPTDIAVDTCGNLLIADVANDRVRRLNLVTACPPSAATPGTAAGPRPAAAVAAAVVTSVFAAVVAHRICRRRKPTFGSR